MAVLCSGFLKEEESSSSTIPSAMRLTSSLRDEAVSYKPDCAASSDMLIDKLDEMDTDTNSRMAVGHIEVCACWCSAFIVQTKTLKHPGQNNL